MENMIQKELLLGNALIGQNSFGYAVRDRLGEIEIVHLGEDNKICRETKGYTSVEFSRYFIKAKDRRSDDELYIKGRQKRVLDRLKGLLVLPITGIPELMLIFSSRKQFLVNSLGETYDLRAKALHDAMIINSVTVRGTYNNQEVYMIPATNVLDDNVYIIIDKHLNEIAIINR